MENYCAFSKDHKCILWLDYEIARQELEECHTLCHRNWIEIERKYKYIQKLRHLLDKHGIPYPEEYEINIASCLAMIFNMRFYTSLFVQ